MADSDSQYEVSDAGGEEARMPYAAYASPPNEAGEQHHSVEVNDSPDEVHASEQSLLESSRQQDASYEVGYEEAQAQEQDYTLLTPQNTQYGGSQRTSGAENGVASPSAAAVAERLSAAKLATPRSALSSPSSRNPASSSSALAAMQRPVRINGLHVAAATASILPPDDPALLPPEANLTSSEKKATMNPAVDAPAFGMLGVYLALVGAQACWSGFHLFAKIAFNYMHPMVLPMIRAWGTAPVMFCICYYHDRNFWRLERRDLFQIAILGFLVCCCCQNLFNLGLMLTTAADGGITQPAVPVFAALMAIMLKRESASYIKFGGITCAVVGTLCIVIGETYLIPTEELDDQSALSSGQGGSSTAQANHNVTPGRRLVGIGCFMLQCFLFAVYLLVQKPLLHRIPTITMTFYTFLFGIPWTTAVAAYFTTQMDWTALPAMWFVSMIYTIAMASVAGFLFFSYATKHLPASTSSMGVTLQPLFSSLLGAIFLGEILTYMHVLGGLFLIAGMGLVVYSRVRESRREKAAAEFARLREEARRDELLEEEIELGESRSASRRTSEERKPEWLRKQQAQLQHPRQQGEGGSTTAMVDLTPRSSLERAKEEYRGEIAASAMPPHVTAASTKLLSRSSALLPPSPSLPLPPPELDFNPAHIEVDDSVASGSSKRRQSAQSPEKQPLEKVVKVASQLGQKVKSVVMNQPTTQQKPKRKPQAKADHPVLGPQEEDPFQ
jgi:drug/metabolite transporter (DMT)-like permease